MITVNKTEFKNPITLKAIENYMDSKRHADSIGKIVAVKSCNENDDENTHLGVMLGDMMHDVSLSVTEDGVLKVRPVTNPAMFVPALKRVVFGYESWWRYIEDTEESELHQITGDDISAVWYVRMFKDVFGEKGGESHD